MNLDLTVDAAAIAGLLLAMSRVAAFVVASPIVNRAVPAVGRVSLVLVLGWFFAEPAPGAVDLGGILGAGFANVVVGLVLGFLTGLIFHLFSVAGAFIDFSSSLSSASVFDPMIEGQAAVFSRAFNLTALTAFLVIGGDRLLVRGLQASFDAIAVDGSIDLAGGLADASVVLVARMTIAALELAMPAIAALFVAEVVLGIAARFAPQANVFLLGLPVKIMAAFASVVAVLLLFPDTVGGVFGIVEDTFIDVISGLS